VFGAGILSSTGEIPNSLLSKDVKREPFVTDVVINTDYDPSRMQDHLFIAPSFPFLRRELEALVRRFGIPVLDDGKGGADEASFPKVPRHKPEKYVRDPNNAPERVLKRIQRELGPEHEFDIVAINMHTGEYVLGKTMGEVERAFRVRWPDAASYMCRVDGGPAGKMPIIGYRK
jgi:hypothetical protein